MTRILDYNILRSATLTASSSDERFPLVNVYSRRRVKQAYFTGFGSEWIKIYSSGMSFDSLVIDSHNLTASATVKLQANATDVWTAPSVDITLTYADAISYFFSAVQSYDYVRITFEDPTNTELIKIGMVFLAESKQVCIRDGFTSSVANIGRARYRTLDFSLPYAIDQDLLDSFFDNTFGTISLSSTLQQFGTAEPFYTVPMDDDPESFPPLFGVLSGDVSRTKVQVKSFGYDIPISVQEVN